MRKTISTIDRTAVSGYPTYCDGYARPGNIGNGYVSVVKVATGTVEKTDDFLLDGIVAYDRAEANDAYIGQINMETASSFCGIAGNVWGYDLAYNSALNTLKPMFTAKQYDGSDLPVYDAGPLIDAGIALFGTEPHRRFPPAPGAHVICANKSTTNLRPRIGEPNPDKGEAYGVWCYIALSITRDRYNSADLFIEDAGTWTKNDNEADLKAFLEEHQKAVAWSIVACGKDQSVLYDRTFMSYAYVIMKPGFVGTALTVAPYITLAQRAVPASGFNTLYDLTLSDWEQTVGFR
ncbi:histidine decarboxylase, pyruvoyl type [Roseibium sp. Sym1]|uniref:histidine decarboxylase, pyruvoyl type n=1 Tax=Roseibium sp. Sym1 TaxID=3016006 RepID=UPI0022B57432|nr:histidine decarboxylase, pyruvoyl type [Roseibium sp. Sym1]